MDEFVVHTGLVAAFPRPAGPRTGEEGLEVIQAGRVEACPLPAGRHGGEDEDLVVAVGKDELVLEEGGVQLTWMPFALVFPRAVPVPGTFQGWHYTWELEDVDAGEHPDLDHHQRCRRGSEVLESPMWCEPP